MPIERDSAPVPFPSGYNSSTTFDAQFRRKPKPVWISIPFSSSVGIATMEKKIFIFTPISRNGVQPYRKIKCINYAESKKRFFFFTQAIWTRQFSDCPNRIWCNSYLLFAKLYRIFLPPHSSIALEGISRRRLLLSARRFPFRSSSGPSLRLPTRSHSEILMNLRIFIYFVSF